VRPRIYQQLSFARHLPPKKLFFRAWLLAKRRLMESAAAMGVVNRSGLAPVEPLSARLPTTLFSSAPKVERELDGSFSFTFLNRRENLGFPVDWHPRDLRKESLLWVLNLHYMEYLSQVSDADFADITLDWIRSNPPYARGYWTYNWNCYSLSIRVVCWMNEIAVRHDRLPDELVAKLAASLSRQIRFLAANLEKDIGGNHLIKDIRALIWSSVFFSGPRAAEWGRLGLKLLDGEIASQILDDGFHYERSPSYHAAVFADLLEIRHILGPGVLAGRLDAALERMAPPIADLCHPDALTAVFSDAGMHMSHSPRACLDAHAEVTGETVRPGPVFAYQDAGYYGCRNDSYYLAVDMGRIGPDDLPGHSHGDIGSFELSVAGQRLIVDQGVFEYSAGPKRDKSRSAASHNVLHIDGGDQAEFFSAFRCGRRPNVSTRFEAAADGAGFKLTGSHDGYANLPGKPVVVRSFEAGPGRVTIEDRIEGRAGNGASVSFLLHPEARVEVAGDRAVIRRGAAKIDLHASAPITVDDDVYWPDMGIEMSTRRLRLTLPDQCSHSRCEFTIAFED
jgi:uncharacterized heparinase superfamily protein